MIRKTISKAIFAFLLVAATNLTVSAQKLDLNKTIPADTSVVKGTLPNGLTYYIKHNAKPVQKVQLRLVVDAGSILENKDQQGLAHFMEHMNFNGLKHFPKNELVHYLQKIGVKFGADLNANTAWDRTYFILPIPTDNPENLDSGFQIVADWAGGALISTDEVNAERHVISEELRMRMKNASTRMRKKYFPAMLNGSRYAYRLPGGKDSIVLNCNPDLIRQFYHDWYRPDLMAVVVVGDISTKKAKAMIKKYFGGQKSPAKERKRVYYDVKPYTQPNAMIVTDSEATNYDFTLVFPSKKRHIEKTLGDYRQALIRSIFTSTLNRKLHELAQSAKPPYTYASTSVGGIFSFVTLNNESFSLFASPVNSFKTTIDSSIAELLRVEKFGFSKTDVSITKKSLLSSYENAYNERNKTLSKDYVGDYVANFMRHEPIPSISEEYKWVKEMLPGISAKEVSAYAAKILSNSKNFFALISGPSKGNIKLPTKDELLKTVQSAFQQQVKQQVAKKSADKLLQKMPTAGKIVSVKKDKDLGTTTYTLSNGILVTVKPTDFKSDDIEFSGVKYGGTGLFDAKDKYNANFATNIVSTMGYGQFTPTALNNFLSGKTVSLTESMTSASNAVSGSSSVKDFTTLLKLNYLELTQPRMDKDLFKGFITKMKTQLKFMTANPQAAFTDTLVKVLYHNSPLTPITIPTDKGLESINPQRCIDIYKNQFGNADGFHFFIVGNVQNVDIKSLIEKYIASLPVKGTKPMYKDNGLRPVAGKKVFKFYKGADNKSLIITEFHGGNIKYSEKLNVESYLLGQLMTMEIIDTIREKMAVIYSGGARASIHKVPYPYYSVMAYMPCGPENVDKILKELGKEVTGFKTNGGPADYLQKAKKGLLEEHKENLKKNTYWSGKLEQLLFWKDDNKDFFLNYDKEIKNITQKDMITTANLLLGKNQFTAVSFPAKAGK